MSNKLTEIIHVIKSKAMKYPQRVQVLFTEKQYKTLEEIAARQNKKLGTLIRKVNVYPWGYLYPKNSLFRILEKIRSARMQVCTNTEIFQEILYRYYSLDRKVLAHQACDILKDIANPIFPITQEDIEKAMSLLKQYTIPVRDAIHTTTMLNHKIRHILSTDIHFDNIQEITRIHPG